jgi:hypothetical protein
MKFVGRWEELPGQPVLVNRGGDEIEGSIHLPDTLFSGLAPLGHYQFAQSNLNLRPLAFGKRLCNPVVMKNKNKRELEKHWAKNAVNKAKPATKKKKSVRHENLNEVAGRIARESQLVEVSQAAARLVGDVAIER